jgi:hypothetical protein
MNDKNPATNPAPAGNKTPRGFAGYFILGAANHQEALEGRGLTVWCTRPPHLLRRWLTYLLLGIRWVDARQSALHRATQGLHAKAPLMNPEVTRLPKRPNR